MQHFMGNNPYLPIISERHSTPKIHCGLETIHHRGAVCNLQLVREV